MENMERLQKLVDTAVSNHPNDIQDATEEVLKKAGRVAWFEKLKDELVRRAIAKLVHDKRHTDNVMKRKEQGVYGGPPRGTVGRLSGQIAHGVMGYFIAGKTLGLLTGEELLETAASESEKATGHQFNVRLCRKLAQTVKGEKTVGQCFSAKKLAAVFESVKK